MTAVVGLVTIIVASGQSLKRFTDDIFMSSLFSRFIEIIYLGEGEHIKADILAMGSLV
jgi:hypothetical protein